MPFALIEVRRRYTADEEVAIVDAVHGALVAAFRIPPADKHVRLVAHEPHRFAVSPGQTDPERYTLITIDCFAGRSVDAKRQLYSEITARLGELGVPPRDVAVVLREASTENFGIRGGNAACDLDLGFKVDV